MPTVTVLRRLRTIAVVAVLLAILAVLVAVVFGAWTVRRSFPQLDGVVEVPGLSGRVEVVRDAHGIPQLYADTAEDLFRAQGYVHAQDRFWEMDVRRHVTAGRLAEMFGPGQVPTDVFVRTLGWRRTAEREVGRLAPATRRYLDAYAAGVNAYLDERGPGARLGVEYALLRLSNPGYKPEKWTATDSVSWLKAMAWDLRTNVQNEIDRALLTTAFSIAEVERLYPPYPYDRHLPIVTRAGPSGATPARPAPPVIPVGARSVLGEVARLASGLPAVLGPAGTGIGSNSWVLAGNRTTTGKPLLANDPHLAPQLPSLWYQMGLRCRTVGAACPFDVAGYTLSGLPGVVIGRNSRIAWGFTNLGADVSDLYLERVSGDTYLYESKKVPLTVRQETVKVAGEADRRITVRESRHGPLLSDVSSEVRRLGAVAPAPQGSPARPRDGYAVALRWTASTPGTTADAIVAMDTARNWAEFRQAARAFQVPAQNLLYADVAGNIGYQAPGQIPIRVNADGRWPVPGWTGEHEWTGYVPFEALPSVFNPPEGYLVTANNAVVGPGFPHLLTTDWGYGYRSARIAELIRQATDGGRKADLATMQRIQGDTRNGNAATLVPYLMAVDVDAFTGSAQDLLRGWDYSQPPDSAAAAYFNTVWSHLLQLVFGSRMPPELRPVSAGGQRADADAQPDGGGRWFEVMRGLLADPHHPWWNVVPEQRLGIPLGAKPSATRDEVLALAMKQARLDLTARLGKDPRTWSWGRLHTLELRNATLGTAGPAPVRRLLNRGPLRLGGGEGIVDATGWNAAVGYEVNWVPSMRMVVDLANLDASRWINLTGASGHVFHRNYTDQTALWARGATAPWPWSRFAVRQAARHTLVLRPRAA